ncbi:MULTISPECIES: ATP-dependent zinc metalloprotease FtsH [unclassified Roseburia]|uniref:ATP-dependent zinc metalloprotease FtsH n=1 Tax=unclassified Roseburia TaxID=2637578 RepID=UPI000E435D45|nr:MULTISPECIES: ATP-dependent zinc metalloprotease FtsH [unclassified Roseburia]RGF46748.1 ATP-dependent metallopeptidase FtsH/Yme1/Tma family protein [Roseburia sp. AF42-8]RGI45900.1 ATP-dependent metallopeptidase FtsH/Yme1/Tma family protein [Roseburia sp. OM03-7AC]RGI48158.1 ATP-dependent metallopeptidase FtsH/Yme1/Tma family protein [Roseburia sp. OM03-18]RHQ42318.1 ATP-dependent metallopeptidase FtsH/Yme1/Tma family protein [Roseburia sp. AF25-18LB]RHQ49173.1 ATP-dependent metallopeptida
MDNLFNNGNNNQNGGNNNQNNGNNNQNGDKKGGNGQMILAFVIITLVTLFFMSLLNRCSADMTSQRITYTEFVQMVKDDKVEKVEVGANQYNITPKSDDKTLVKMTYYTGFIKDENLLDLLNKHNVEIDGYIPNNTSTWVFNILSIVLPLIIIWIIFGAVMKKAGGGMMGVGKSNAKVYVEKTTGVTFKDVAGQDEAKESLQEVVDFLHNPKKYREIGAKLPKGALLVGPPGTGKTLLAKAVAGEANVPFFSLAGSDFVEMFVGVGASRVRDLFKDAQKQAPCIIFIDEIDAIGKSRDSRFGGGNDEREQTLNQLLAEMDGFDTSKGLLVLAATNRPEVLDKALLRPGRFDRRIIVDKPDLKGRLETLKVHSKDVHMDESVDLEAIALASAGLVGSDLANMINEAAINAVKHNRKFVNQSDLFEAFEIVAVGGKEKKDRAMSNHEKKIVSYHEVGHAMVTALQKNTEPVQKITIVPRTMGALGYTLQTPEEEKFLETKDELIAKITTYMAGRAAEELVFHSATSGAANDIENATKIARAMITQFGMSDKFGMMSLASVDNAYLDGAAHLNCGDETAAQIDEEVRTMIHNCYQEAYQLLEENREVLDHIADYLYEHETITGKEFMKIFRELKGLPDPDEEKKEEEDQKEENGNDV